MIQFGSIIYFQQSSITLTWNASTERHFLIIVSTVDHGHGGGVGHGFADVGTVDEISGVLDTEVYSPLSHHKSKSIHDIRFA